MDKFRALRYFKRTSELNSFSLAGKEFDVPASSISRRIKDLENELGVTLLQRSTRHVSLTELGSVYYQMICEVLQKLQDADELLSQRAFAMEGKIRISTVPSYGEKVLAPILQKFRQQYPDISLEIDFSDKLSNFDKDPVDIVIRAGNQPQERVVAKHLSNAEFILVATPNLLQELQEIHGKKVLTVEDLKNSPTLQYRGPYGLISWWALENEDWQEVEINPVFSCNSGEALLGATLAGEGLSMYPHWWIKEAINSGQLVQVPVTTTVSNKQNERFDIYLCYQQAKYKIPKIKECVDFIMRHLA